MIISIDAESDLTKSNTHDKIPQQNRKEGNFLNFIETIHKKP